MIPKRKSFDYSLLKVEKNVPIPGPRAGMKPTLPERLKELKIGDCLTFPGEIDSSNVLREARILGIKVTSRIVPEGLRIWRIRNDSPAS